MRQFVLLIFVFCLFQWSFAENNSQFVKKSFHSEALNQDREYFVSYPKNYGKDPSQIFPVIIFLHGASAKPSTYINSFDPFLNWLAPPLLFPAFYNSLVIIPDGSVKPYNGSFYTNSDWYGNFEDYIYSDLINEIRSKYQVSRFKDKWSIMGHSMGGYGAMKMALKHPELFEAVAALSAPLNITYCDGWLPSVLHFNGDVAPYSFDYHAGGVTNLIYTMAGAFSPDTLSDPPINFPVDEQGVIKPEVMDLWMKHNVADYLRNFDKSNNLKMMFYCGRMDQYFTYKQNIQFRDSCKKYHVDYKFERNMGTHVNSLVLSFVKGVNFVYKAMMKAEGNNIDQFNDSSIGNTLPKIYPNPVHRELNIDNRIQVESLKMYDMLGNEISLVSYNAECGIINVENLSNGAYLLVILTEQGAYLRTRIIKQ